MMLLFAEQFPEPDLEKIEDEAIPNSVDAISVIQELPVCHSESGINLARTDVSDVPEAEILVCNASASPSNCNLNLSEPVRVNDSSLKSKSP